MYAFLSGGVAGLVEQRFWLRWALHSLSFAAVLMGLSCEAASPCSSNQLLSPILGVPCWAGADINRDGQSDVLLYSSANTAYYAGIADSNHDGNFGNGLGYPSALWSGGFSTIKMADFNGDGIMDVLLYKSDGSQTVVAIGRGNGYFDYYAVFFSPGYTVEAGDLDGDGKADLILYNAATGTTYLATNWSSASNNFTTYTYNLWSPGFTRICAADFNGDGVSDVLMYRLSDGQAYVGINNTPQGSAFSAFTFYWEAFNAGYDFLQAGDLNADGKTDLIVYNSSTGLSYTLFWNGSGNYFNGVSLPNLSTGYTQVQVADVTGDGIADVLFYSKATGSVYFAAGRGDGTFTYSSFSWSPGYDYVERRDLNGDHKMDFVLYNASTGTEYSAISQGGSPPSFSYSYNLWSPGLVLGPWTGEWNAGSAPPSVSSISPTAGPVGMSVTITGTNFGTTQGSSTVRFNGTAIGATATFWSASTITVQVPTGAATGPVTVTVNGFAAQSAQTFTMETALQAFRDCVGSGGSSANPARCPLAGGTYTVLSPIMVAPYVDIGGSTDINNRTRLVRGQNLTGSIMRLGEDAQGRPVALTGVTIHDLTICGASIYRQGDPSNPNPCGPVTQLANQTYCEAHNSCDAEVFITNTAGGQLWAAAAAGAQAPFNKMGANNPYNVTITNCQFEDSPAPGHPLFIAPFAGESVNDVYLSHNVISSGGVQIGAYNTTINWGDSTQCDNWKATHGNSIEFADDTTVPLPRNIRFDSNIFYVNAGAVSGRGRYVQVTNNTINGYYWTSGGGGGAIQQDWCSDQVKITNNTVCGNVPQPGSTCGTWQPGSTGPSGMELYSRNMTVDGNTVSGYALEGIGIFSTLSATVTNNHLYNNNVCSGSGDPQCTSENNPDIKIATRFPWPGTCHPGGNTCDYYRDTSGLTITGNDSAGQPAGKVQYGIFFDACCDGSTDNVTGDVVSANNLSVTGMQWACDPHVSANTCPPSTQIGGTPHTIAPFPEGSLPLGAPLGPNDPALRTPAPANERYFRFGANDPGGPGNFNNYYCANPPQCTSFLYASIQGVFDAVADPSPTSPGNPHFGDGGPYSTQAACRFAYFPVTNTIYLDAPSANFTFTAGSSVVGSGGSILDNGVCAINAGNSTRPTGQQYIELVLDIAFHQTGTWYIYEVTNNSQGNGSFSNQNGITGNWSHWGYWPVTSAQ